jgi:hypothetical protein
VHEAPAQAGGEEAVLDLGEVESVYYYRIRHKLGRWLRGRRWVLENFSGVIRWD